VITSGVPTTKDISKKSDSCARYTTIRTRWFSHFAAKQSPIQSTACEQHFLNRCTAGFDRGEIKNEVNYWEDVEDGFNVSPIDETARSSNTGAIRTN
jgi:hypothetical protein